ncbi:MAG: hypothetical protein APF77_10905 [Clostridia bacterium BRH_c25]|nr:MAG: hypothetical protein APF77_10905 [Clostridia bacterium BRH_c25]
MIQISTRQALIGIESTAAKINISQPHADMQIESKQAVLDIHTEHVRVQIDQRQCFNEVGLMSNSALLDNAAQQGEQAVMEAISKAASEGDSLAAIENGGGAIASIAYSNSFHEVDYNIVSMPRSRPSIEILGGTIDIKIDDGYVNLQITASKPEIDYQPGRVSFYLRQHPEVNITYTDSNIDIKV